MQVNDRQLGKPFREYVDTAANIEALSLDATDKGCVAYATDTGLAGWYDGSAWMWGTQNRARSFFVPAIGGYDCNANVPIPPGGNGTSGVRFPDAVLCLAFGEFSCPSDFFSDMTATVVLRSASGNIWGTNGGYYGACGENYYNHVDFTDYEAVAVVALKRCCVFEVPLVSIAIGDIISLIFTRNASAIEDTVNDAIVVYGWLIEYTADS